MTDRHQLARTLVRTRRAWHARRPAPDPAGARAREACEGGCGVVGVASDRGQVSESIQNPP